MSAVKTKILDKLRELTSTIKSTQISLSENNLVAINSIIQSILSIEQEIDNIKTKYVDSEEYKKLSKDVETHKQLFLTGWLLHNI